MHCLGKRSREEGIGVRKAIGDIFSKLSPALLKTVALPFECFDEVLFIDKHEGIHRLFRSSD